MRIDILTLMPEMFDGPFGSGGIIARAQASGVVDIHVTNIRDFATDKYRKVDDNPFGGGPGMVMMCRPVFDAVEHVKAQGECRGPVIMMTPQGRPFDQATAERLAGLDRIMLLAGRYEGFDERIRTGLVDEEISLGDFVLSGGEIAAMAVTDAVVRLLPGALGCEQSTESESFASGLLEYPQYTRPREFRGMAVPDVLLGGNHAEIEAWRLDQAELRTRLRRADLWQAYTSEDRNSGENK